MKKFTLALLVLLIIGGLFPYVLFGGAWGVLIGVISIITLISVFGLLLVGIYAIGLIVACVQKRDITLWSYSYIGLCALVSLLVPYVGVLGVWYIDTHIEAPLTTYELSNGERLLVFQSMSHIASPEFYDDIYEEMTSYIQDGYVIYLEGVQPGTEENMVRFNQMLGVEFEAGFYDQISDLTGLISQDTLQERTLETLTPIQYQNVDMSIDDIVARAKEDNVPEVGPSGFTSGEEIREIMHEFSSYPEYKKKLIRMAYRSLMKGMMLILDDLDSALMGNDIFSIILDDRNAYIAETFLNSDEEKVLMQYGALHFEGIYELLRESDDRWRIIGVKQYNPFGK